MARRSLSEILADLDASKITVDSSGRVGSADPAVAARLAELRKVLEVAPPVGLLEPNGVQCHCGSGGGGPIQSGCGE